ncbi:MAG: peptidylprolyl isomerase [Ectobacillus sp.]
MHKKMKKTYAAFLLLFMILTVLLGGCGANKPGKQALEEPKQRKIEKNPVATIVMENNGQIKAELYPNVAPNTVANFISLAEKGFYNGLVFHRVIPGFMIQGGDPEKNGMGGPGYHIKGEFKSNGFKNDLKHERGVLSMARSNDPNSAGSQFFIMVADAKHLDGEYAAFGKVIEGIDVVDRIVKVKRNKQDKPIEEQKIKTITIETFGEKYEKPITQ